MAQHESEVGIIGNESQNLLSAVAEHLKQPLLYVKNAAELTKQSGTTLDSQALQISAESGLLLIEQYITWQRHAYGATQKQEAQIGLSAIMREVSDVLRHIAKQQQVELHLTTNGRYAPVLTNSELFSSGMSALGLAFIEAATSTSDSKVVFGVHKTRWGLVAGVYSSQIELSAEGFNRRKKHAHMSRQQLPLTSHAPMSGVAIAEAIFNLLPLQLRPARHKGMDGLAVTLPASPQLALL